MHSPLSPDALQVVCLCAAWCGSCRDYRSTFDAVAAAFPGVRFEWVDIEDEADLVDPVEVENFPTVLIAAGSRPVFFGTVLPHRDTLMRLVRTHADASGGAAMASPEVAALVMRLQARKP